MLIYCEDMADHYGDAEVTFVSASRNSTAEC